MATSSYSDEKILRTQISFILFRLKYDFGTCIVRSYWVWPFLFLFDFGPSFLEFGNRHI